ncbi:MAG: hypothetical protein ACI9PY_001239 [Ascidiaceihabitans sp.]|jgi:hypothetical protein
MEHKRTWKRASLRHWIKRYSRDEDGSIAIEMMLLLPMLFWAFLTLFSIFDAYRKHSMNQKAAFTIGDMISRETALVNQAYLNGTQQLLSYLTNADLSDTSIRITSVKYDADNNIYKRDWSKTKGWVPELGNNDIKNWNDRLPVMPHNERIMVVETFVKYDPPYNTGLSDHEIVNFVFTRPRYAPQVLWDHNS